jgi:transcription elongation factor GreA
MSDKPLYISTDGLQRLKDEFEYLTKTKKQEVADRIDHAKDLGDLKENAEYHDAKDEMAFVSGRIMELADSINRAVIIEKSADGMVSVGSNVKVRFTAAGKEKEKTLTITGAAESDPLQGLISNESPLGQGLLGRAVGDSIDIEIPAGKASYTILEIS